MGKMKDIAIELQQAEETIQRGIHIVEYLERKLKLSQALEAALREQISSMQIEMQDSNQALLSIRTLLNEYIDT